ncbi:TonB-dependent receptor domain-containing protein [Pontivivens ytuae]|uniref:TonB-dependent receptor n=1 Tax=Pontivivens ytuae TaxID=2789856 RepID=A0A7S9QCT7_9RHOB|nr:TonB-dependent receptor [Pontivivens ytuae]QPH54170.1 TonB-dependent receptor [Pontivivens ytuae]
MRRTPPRAHLLSATALIAITTPAIGQDNVTPLQRLVFTDGGSDTVAIDTPQAVTVLDQEDIDAEQATTVGELFDLVPGVQSIGSDRPAGVSFNIRGIGELAASDESKIIVTVDGATKFHEQYRVGSFFSDPELYRQVEVLRGPASSTLFGSGALGGVINFETKDPSDFLDGPDDRQALRLRGQFETNGNEYLGSAIYAVRPSESFETLFALNYRNSDNFEDGNGDEVSGSEFDATSGLAKGVLTFGDAGEQTLTGSYTIWNSELDDTDYSQTGTLPFGEIDRDIRDQTATLRWQNPAAANPFLDLDVVLSYSDTEVEQANATSGFASPLFADSEYSYETASLKVENTFEMAGGSWQNFLTTGFQLSRQERIAETSQGPLGFHPEGTDEKLGLYVQSELILGNGLTLIPGVRVDFTELEPGSNVDGDDSDETAFSPKLAALYEVTDTFNVFGSVAMTERVPTLDELFSSDGNEPSSPGLDPEEAMSAELGFSQSFLGVATAGDALDFKVTGFYSEIDDLIERDDTAGTPFYRNVDSATIYGIELEGAYETDRAFARLAYSDVRGEDDETGETLESVPARTLAFTIGGRDLERDLDFGWRATLVDSISYEDESFGGYALHDLFATWRPDAGSFAGTEVRFSIENVLDKQFQNSLAGDPGPGRSFALTVSRAI